MVSYKLDDVNSGLIYLTRKIFNIVNEKEKKGVKGEFSYAYESLRR